MATPGGTHDPSRSALFELGIDEIEPMVCEDTFENRRILREAKLAWDQVNDENGMPSGLIRAFTPEALTARRDSVWETRKPIMRDPTNMYSEYLDPADYPMDADMPWWLKQRLRGYMQELMDGVPEEKRRQFPVRCEVIRLDGTRCWNWAPNPKDIKRCKQHRGWVHEKELRAAQVAKIKILQAAPAMADELEHMALTATGEAVKLKAITEVLDRAGVRGGIELDVHAEIEHKDPAGEVQERLGRLAERLAAAAAAREPVAELEAPPDTVEAEIVEKETEDDES